MLYKEKAMPWIAMIVMLALVPALARAEEPEARLKPATGVDMVEAQCGACHSLRYILMNSPFLSPVQWDAKSLK